jgi:pimeloyl-ACP methyl ester carboxylesterase
VLAIFGGLVSTAGEGGQQMSSHPPSLAEGGGLSGASDNVALLSELGQNGSHKSTTIATSVPHAGASGMQAPRGSKFQYDLITFVNCSFYVWYRFQNNDSKYFANKPAELYRWNPASSHWEKIQGNNTNADGRVEFHLLKETEPGTYAYIVTCQGQYSTPEIKVLLTYPIILVHGWLGSEETWTEMKQTLDNAGFVEGTHYFLFNYNGYDDPRKATPAFKDFVEKQKAIYRDQYGYNECKFTIVCHSMGALVTRWYMELMGGAENVVQWIGLGPVNRGSASANKIPDSVLSAFSAQLGKPAVLQLRTDSDTVKTLESGHLAPGVTYRVIVGDNENNRFGFGSNIGLPAVIYLFFVKGKTWASLPGCTCTPLPKWEEPRGCYLTLRGDGAVANVQSWIDSADFRSYTGVDHTGLHRDRNVTNYVLACIENPNKEGHKVGLDNFLYPNDPDAPH